MTLRALFVDMNAFFASVEQQLRPELRGRPTAVAAVAVDTTACIAASYEAKPCGIRTGTMVREAKRLCPSLRVVEARPTTYVRFHHAILAAVDTCLPVGEVHSIDELSCRLMGDERRPERAVELARRIKGAIYRDVGPCLRCSIGIAPNRLLAKIASNMRKPDGLVVLDRRDLPHKLYPLELVDLPGIGSGMLRRLDRRGVRTVERLCALSEEQMAEVWGSVVGRRWHRWLRGDDLADPPTRRRTVSHSHVLPPELRSEEGAHAVLVRLIHKAAARLRRLDCWARRMSVYISFSSREEGWEGEVALGLCRDTLTMIQALRLLWQRRPRHGTPTQVAITLYPLETARNAGDPLFLQDEARARLAQTMDTLNARFGPDTAYFAAMHTARESAPTRISFTHVPDV